MVELVTLYRPVGRKELALIEESGFTAFPPRLPEQPIFYPVTNKEYATQIARDWNSKMNDDRVGYVTKFNVAKAFLDKYERQIVGGSEHEEYWIPSEDLAEFNLNIVGLIEVIAEFHGEEKVYMKWFEYLPNHWQRRVRDHLASSQSKYGELSAADFTHDLRLKFEDGSDAFFRYAFYLHDELESEVVVFTEHCGYHVFPFCISGLETIDKEGNVLQSESFLID